MRTKRCSDSVTKGRLKLAIQFWHAAESVRALADRPSDISNVYVTNCVHAGIAAADAICCKVLGEHARSDNHSAAVDLLKTVRPDGNELGKALGTLLGMKSQAGYGAEIVSADDMRRAERAAAKLVTAARDRIGRE
jgi:hypothetical protein